MSESDPLFTLLIFGALAGVGWLILNLARHQVLSIGDFGQAVTRVASTSTERRPATNPGMPSWS